MVAFMLLTTVQNTHLDNMDFMELISAIYFGIEKKVTVLVVIKHYLQPSS